MALVLPVIVFQRKVFYMYLSDSNSALSILSTDGEVNYYGKAFTPAAAEALLEYLLTGIAWENDVVMMFGKRIVTKRKVAWYGDGGFEYTYSKITRKALPWTSELIGLKALAEKVSGATYNSCLLNLYHDGTEGMGWHSDNESSIRKNSAIASLSLGAERRFSLKHKVTGKTISLLLEAGSLLIMQGSTQTNWLHSMPKSSKVMGPRINLTFRSMIG